MTFDEAVQVEGTRTVDLRTNSVAGSGAGPAHAEHVDGPITSESVLWRTWAVVRDQKLHPNHTVYILVDATTVLDSSGNPFVGRSGRDF